MYLIDVEEVFIVAVVNGVKMNKFVLLRRWMAFFAGN